MLAEAMSKQNLSEVFQQHKAPLKGFIRKRVNSEEDSEDILQEVFYQLVKADSLLKPIEQMTAWLYSVTRNKIIDWRRKKKVELFPEYSTDDDDSFSAELSDVLLYDDDDSNPETKYLRSLVWQELERALSELPVEQQEVFELTEMQGLSFKEINKQTGVPINTLISRKRYAVLHLRERLNDLYNDLLNMS